MTSSPLRVAVLSPEEVVVRGFSDMLTAPDGGEEISALPEVDLGTDVVLYDVLGLHRHGSVELDEVLRHDRLTVVAVGRALRPDLLTQALALGAHAAVEPDVDGPVLREAVRTAPGTTSDRPVLREGVARMPSELGGGQRLGRLGADVRLTDREVDVLTFITHGLSNHEVAAKCYLSINSVKTYIRSAYRKIGAESRTQAVIWCLQHGFSPQVP